MFEYIQNLREKPESHRRKVAVATTSGIMVVIAAIWVMTFTTRFPEFSGAAQSQNEASAIIAESPLDSLKSNVSGNYSSFQELFNAQSTSTVVKNGVTISNTNSNDTGVTLVPEQQY